jgi:hypothetical protein
VLALALAAVAGRRTGDIDDGARVRALRRRLVDDAVYQARIRRRFSGELFGDSIAPVDDESVARAEAALTAELRGGLDALLPGEPIAAITLPWSRSFEVDVRFADEA